MIGNKKRQKVLKQTTHLERQKDENGEGKLWEETKTFCQGENFKFKIN